MIALMKIPSMGGERIARHLTAAASRVRPGESAVEVGTWLGAGTAAIVRGLPVDAPMHCYDRFTANAYEVGLAGRYGVKLAAGHDTLPMVRWNLESLRPDIQYHRCNVADCRWDGGPIGLYVDDAGKTDAEFLHKLRTFGPSWVSGCAVFLMDLHFHELRKGSVHHPKLLGQSRFVARFPASLVKVRDHGKNGGEFRYMRGIDFAGLEAV